MTKTRQWAIMTVIAVLVVLAGGYKFLVSGQRSTSSDLKQQVSSEQASTAQLQDSLEQLEAQKKNLPEQQKILEGIAAKIPDEVDLSTLIRQMQQAETSSGVTLTNVSPSAPTAVTASATTPTTSTATTTPASSTLSLYQMPLSIMVNGTYFNAEMFLHTLESLPRAMLVTSFTLSPDTTPTTVGAKPPTNLVTMQLNAEVFLSPAAETAPAVPSTSTGTTSTTGTTGDATTTSSTS